MRAQAAKEPKAGAARSMAAVLHSSAAAAEAPAARERMGAEMRFGHKAAGGSHA